MRQALEKLRLQINWYMQNQNSWQGECRQTNKNFSAMIIDKRNNFQVEIKQNNRRISSDCKVFHSFIETEKYLHSYVADTMFV